MWYVPVTILLTKIVWSAGVASNSQGSFPGLWGDVGILCKDEIGEIVPWGSDGISHDINLTKVGQVPYTSRLDAALLDKFPLIPSF